MTGHLLSGLTELPLKQTSFIGRVSFAAERIGCRRNCFATGRTLTVNDVRKSQQAGKSSVVERGLLFCKVSWVRLRLRIGRIHTHVQLGQRVLRADRYRCIREPRDFGLRVIHVYHLLLFLIFSAEKLLVGTSHDSDGIVFPKYELSR